MKIFFDTTDENAFDTEPITKALSYLTSACRTVPRPLVPSESLSA